MSEMWRMSRTRMAAVIGVVILLGGGLAGCTSAPLTGSKGLDLVSDSELRKVSVEAFEEIKRLEAPGLDPDQNEMLQRVGQRIADEVFWDLPGAQWEFVVFNSPSQVNAFAMAGGKVGVYSGIFKVATSDDELAVVVAHEISHVVAKHVNQKLSQEMAMKVVGGGLAVATGGAGLLAYQGVMLAYGFGSGVVGLGFDRNKEREADRMGLMYMAKAGYDPRAAMTLWQKMDDLDSQGLRPPPNWLSTHPSNLDRMSRFRKLMPTALEYYEKAKASGLYPADE